MRRFVKQAYFFFFFTFFPHAYQTKTENKTASNPNQKGINFWEILKPKNEIGRSPDKLNQSPTKKSPSISPEKNLENSFIKKFY